jgi:ElaB/YqjD/DUF883 family membrane-anchored ribosome-binding protein
MGVDVVVSHELSSLQDELADSQRDRLAASSAPPTSPSASTATVEESPDERELRDQLRELVHEITNFFEEAEKHIAAHPTQSVVGAFLAGILIGRLLGHR